MALGYRAGVAAAIRRRGGRPLPQKVPHLALYGAIGRPVAHGLGNFNGAQGLHRACTGPEHRG
jgi:hypothetical protein